MSPQPAYVLIARPYRETSLLVEAFTAQEGRVGLVARAARSSRGQPMRALLQPLQPLALAWRGRGELPTISQVEALGPAHPIPPDRLLAAFYVNELLLRMQQRQDHHPGLFDRYAAVLTDLAADAPPAWALRRFERDLLALCGYALQLDHDADGAAIAADAHYRYDPERGPVRCAPEGRVFPGSALLALRDDAEPAAALERTCRHLLRSLLENHAHARIRSYGLSATSLR